MKTIRDHVSQLAMNLCRFADSAMQSAKDEALEALDGDADARDRVNRWRARSEAYTDAMRQVDALVAQIDRGEVV